MEANDLGLVNFPYVLGNNALHELQVLNEQKLITFGMIKAHAFPYREKILRDLETAGFTILAVEEMLLSRESGMLFYQSHRDKKFYDEIVRTTFSGPVVGIALSLGEIGTVTMTNVVDAYRFYMGDMVEPAQGTLRFLYRDAKDPITKNAVHGADAYARAILELGYFFPETRIREWLHQQI
jgi:nucleoside-diphosphate kinase